MSQIGLEYRAVGGLPPFTQGVHQKGASTRYDPTLCSGLFARETSSLPNGDHGIPFSVHPLGSQLSHESTAIGCTPIVETMLSHHMLNRQAKRIDEGRITNPRRCGLNPPNPIERIHGWGEYHAPCDKASPHIDWHLTAVRVHRQNLRCEPA